MLMILKILKVILLNYAGKNCTKAINELLIQCQKEINKLKSEIMPFIDDDFRKWLENIKGEINPIKDHHGKRVAEAYFEGKPPFKRPKNRDDFPDAFIWETIIDLLGTVDVLHVISNDSGMINACKNIDGILLYESLDAFIKSDICHEKLSIIL
jgi:hypothetical protein